jgi:hypothetical protein
MAKKINLKEKFEKWLRAIDMTSMVKPYKKPLSASVNEKVVRESIEKGVSKK